MCDPEVPAEPGGEPAVCDPATCGAGGGEAGGCGGHTEEVPEDDEGLAVAREEHVTLTFDADSEDDVRGWPRRMCISGSGDSRRHGLWYPDATGAARFHELTDRDRSRYQRVTGHNRRARASTWGELTPVSVTVSEIVTTAGVNELTWRSDGPTYSFDVYGLEVRPAWRLPLECTLMGFAISHLHATGLKSLCFDIRQPSQPPGRYVTDGGATWLYNAEGLARRAAGRPTADDDSDGRPAIFVAFAALNRPWWERPNGPVLTEDEIDSVYQARGAQAVVFDTLYHEHGHHFLWHMAEPASPEVRALLRRSDLWQSYLDSIPYGGNTTQYIEGFAEIYRRVFNGAGFRGEGYSGGADLTRDIQTVIDGLGMPTPESVTRTREAILRNKGLW